MKLTDQKIFFNENGYLIVEDLLTNDEVETCQKEIDRLHNVYNDWVEQDDPRHRRFQIEPFSETRQRDDGLPILRKIEGTREVSNLFRELPKHPRLVEVLQNLIGPDLLLFRSTLMLKPAFYGSAHGLHQDSSYWNVDPPHLITVSIALNDATVENGCIKVIPQSHRWGLQSWGDIARDDNRPLTDRKDVDLSGQIDAPLRAGSALLFHSLTVHGSGPNRSPNSRNTALYAFFSPDLRVVGKSGQKRTFPVIAGLDGKSDHTMIAS